LFLDKIYRNFREVTENAQGSNEQFDERKKAQVAHLLQQSFPAELNDSMAKEVTYEEIKRTIFYFLNK
jgi:hypothetical protein